MRKLENISDRRTRVCCLSALNGEGVSILIEKIRNLIEPEKFSETLFFPFEFGKKRAWLHENGVVVNEVFKDVGYEIEVIWSAWQKAKYKSFTD